MSNFEIKYLKEVLSNLKLIKDSVGYNCSFDSLIEYLEEIIKEYTGEEYD